MPCPLFGNQIKMVEDNLAHFPPQARRKVIGSILFNLINFGVQPEFAFAVTLTRMNMQRLISLVRVEEEPPALH
jgi:hypothetical protein